MKDPMENISKLTTLNTKTLLRYLGLSRENGSKYYSPTDDDCGWTLWEFKKELATREHVLNKKEAKLKRQLKFKNKR